MSEQHELKQILTDHCAEFAEKEYEIYNKYRMKHLSQYDDYLPYRGGMSIRTISRKEIVCDYLDYSRGWDYEEILRFPLDDLENKDFIKLENDVKQKRIQHLENDKYRHLTNIDLIDREIVELSK